MAVINLDNKGNAYRSCRIWVLQGTQSLFRIIINYKEPSQKKLKMSLKIYPYF